MCVCVCVLLLSTSVSLVPAGLVSQGVSSIEFSVVQEIGISGDGCSGAVALFEC